MHLQDQDLVKAVELSGGSVLATSAARAEHSRRDGAFLLVKQGSQRAALPSVLRQLPFTTAALLAVRVSIYGYINVKPCSIRPWWDRAHGRPCRRSCQG